MVTVTSWNKWNGLLSIGLFQQLQSMSTIRAGDPRWNTCRSLNRRPFSAPPPQGPFGQTPLYVAAEENRVELVNALLRAGANKEAATQNGWTPLHAAAWAGRVQVGASGGGGYVWGKEGSRRRSGRE